MASIYSEKKYYALTIVVAFAIIAFLNFAVNSSLLIGSFSRGLWHGFLVTVALLGGITANNTLVTITT